MISSNRQAVFYALISKLVIIINFYAISNADDILTSTRCTSYPVVANCGNSTHTVILSADICRQQFFDSKCKICISASKLRDVLEKFDSCKLNIKHLDNQKHFLKKNGGITLGSATPKRFAKRQIDTMIPEIMFCESVAPPKPGKVSCHILPSGMSCVGTCNDGYKFSDDELTKEMTCADDEGIWRPHSDFLPCEPQCDPPCQNGGSCLEVNRCFCSNEFRGTNCEYPISLCGIAKTESASSWQCNHTEIETMCNIACYPPGSAESLINSQFHICSYLGDWTPELPSCVESLAPITCSDPGNIANGWKEVTYKIFYVGAVVSYSCYGDHEMIGESNLVCLTSRQWSAKKPVCESIDKTTPTNQESCVYTGAPMNADGKLFVSSVSEISHLSLVKPIINIQSHILPVGTRIQYRCRSQYYKLYGSEYQTCQETGSWSGYKPTCIPECGKSDSPKTPYIVHGNSTMVGQWPWQVAIGVWDTKDKRLHLTCGGALVAEKWIITAAHCVTVRNSNTATRTEPLSLYVGKYYRSFTRDDEYVQKKKVRQVIIHDDYDFIRFDADIALVELDSPVELTSRVQPICLPSDSTTRENIKDGNLGVVTGWGLTEHNKYSEELKESVLPVVSHSRCEENYRQGLRSITVTENMFCAGFDDGQVDTCIGDSGGPMMFLDESQRPNRWILEGIVSWGSGNGCGQSKRFAGFTKVRKFVEWIKMFI